MKKNKSNFLGILSLSLLIPLFSMPVFGANRQQNPIVQFSETGITASYTQKSSDTVIRKTNTGTAIIVTLLPVGTLGTKGQLLYVVGSSDASTYNLTIDGYSSELINGSATKVISKNYGSVLLRNNGTSWDVLSDNSTTEATDSLSVHLAGTETITGNKTLSGTTILSGSLYKRGFETKAQGTPTAETGAATITITDMLTGIITVNQSTGATVALTTDTGTAIDAGVTMSAGDSFDFTIINLSAAALDTATLTAGASGVTLVGRVIVPSSHSTTIQDSSMTFRVRKTASNTFIIYAI